jgi:hypothetical protein
MCVVVLQNSMGLVNVVPGSEGETCDYGNQDVSIKDEDFKEFQVDDDPVQITFSPVKTEQEVCPCIIHLTSCPRILKSPFHNSYI